MNLKITLLLFFLVIPQGCVQKNKKLAPALQPTQKQDINEVIHNLSQQISSTMLKKNKKKVAVTHFLTIRGDLTDLGLFLSDKLTNSLFQFSDKFEVVERTRMEALQEEISLGFSGLIDDSTAQDLGNATGADAIVIGTITDLVEYMDVSLRMLGTKRANVIAVATATLEKSQAVESLFTSIRALKKKFFSRSRQAKQDIRTCKDIFDNDLGNKDGYYKIDPDGPDGELEAFEVYCDMTHEGGGWTLYANHADGIATIQELEKVGVSEFGVMKRKRWQAIRDNMRVGMLFIDEAGRESTISSEKLKSGNCKGTSYVEDLTRPPRNGAIWHHERSGCNATGLDYSLIQLQNQEFNAHGTAGAALYQQSSLKFDKWPYPVQNHSYELQNRLL
ncbi:MAG: FlgO family outer membrane protein, partial [Nitrospinota bacterium]